MCVCVLVLEFGTVTQTSYDEVCAFGCDLWVGEIGGDVSCVYEIDIDHNNNRPCANGARSLMILWVRLNCVDWWWNVGTTRGKVRETHM